MLFRSEFIIFNLKNFEKQKLKIYIYNSKGKLVREFFSSYSPQLKIPTSKIGSDGMYFYNMRTDDEKVFNGTFVIQR